MNKSLAFLPIFGLCLVSMPIIKGDACFARGTKNNTYISFENDNASRMICLEDLSTGQTIRYPAPHADDFTTNKQSKLIAVSASLMNRTYVYNLETGNPLYNIPGCYPVIDPTGRYIITNDYEKQCLHIWHAKTGDWIRTIFRTAGSHIQFSPDGNYFTTEDCNVISTWKTATGVSVGKIERVISEEKKAFQETLRTLNHRNAVARKAFVHSVEKKRNQKKQQQPSTPAPVNTVVSKPTPTIETGKATKTKLRSWIDWLIGT